MRTRNVIGVLFVATVVSFGGTSADAQVCPVTTSPPDGAGNVSAATAAPNNFATYAADTNSGVIVNAGSQLALRRETGSFAVAANNLGTEPFRAAAAVDVDNDGWVDIVAGKRRDVVQRMRVLLNANQASPPSVQFTPAPTEFGVTSAACSIAMVGGDFNNDNFDDLIRLRCNSGTAIADFELFLNDGSGTVTAIDVGVTAMSTPSSLGQIEHTTTSMIATDWNGDTCLDVLLGNTATSGANQGQISILINDCNPTAPTFTQTQLLTGLDFDDGPNALGYADVDNDGFDDIVASSLDEQKIVMWLSDGSGGFQAAQTITSGFGYAQGLWLADFSLDGYPDLIWTVDDSPFLPASEHGKVYYWENEADGTPFDTTLPVMIYQHPNDMDAGAILDFDHDANNTLDLVIGEVSSAVGNYATLRNGAFGANLLCGEIESGTIPLGTLSSAEFAVQSARITPTESLTAPETIEYYMSNTSNPTWVLASDCDSGTRGPDWCVTFPTPSGRDIRWKAVMCRDSGDVNSTPLITSVAYEFDYFPAITQFSAGVVTSNGIVYAGGFQDVNDKGKFFAINGDLSGAPLWEAGTEIDGQSTRNLYTTEFGNPTNRIDFSKPASAALTTVLGAPTAGDADDVIDFVKGPRFGQVAKSTLGSIVNSTAAVMTPPGLPPHYTFLDQNGRAEVDAFVALRTARDILIFVASKAGIIHAIRTDPEDLSATTNGQEAWGFIPDGVAGDYYSNYSASVLVPSTPQYVPPGLYIDGSPSLADVWDGTQYITNLIVTGGDGATLMTSLDVTDSASSGPTPLWTDVVTGAGKATTKPAVVRVDDLTQQGKFMIVSASGLSPTNTTPPFTSGKRIVGKDIAGNTLWFFDAACPITTDITAYETDDGAPFGSTDVINGFTDQVVFGDFCGNVYMINVNDIALYAPSSPPVLVPAANVLGAFDTGEVDINTDPILAFFSTTETDALGAGNARPIVGGIAARPDSTGNIVLYFGTGGHGQVDPSLPNEFYALYAYDRSMRAKLVGDCVGRCEKFYGSAVITETQVLFVATKDPVNGTCDDGSSRIILADNAPGASDIDGAINSEIVDAAVLSPIFAAANAIIVTTVTGNIVQLGETTQPTPGGAPSQATSTQDAIKGEYIAISGWRQVLH